MKSKIVTLILLLSLVLTACGTSNAVKELEENDTNKAQAKVEDTSSNAAPITETEEEADSEENEEIWTYYNEATWSDNFNGLISEIQKVVVTDKAPKDYDENDLTASAVGIKFKLENTTDGIFNTYPDQAVLVTSTGEQIDMPDMFLSDNLGGEIEKGVIKEGNIIWFLERGHANDITWIKLKWSATQGDLFGDGERKEYAVELQLK